MRKPGARDKKAKFLINDHADILVEILKRLDERSLGVAECVCRLWCSLSRNESLWEHLCFDHGARSLSNSVRPVVQAMGGYRRLYMMCLGPILRRHGGRRWPASDGVQLSLSLMCVEYYERLGPRQSAPSSLMFLNSNFNSNCLINV